MNKHTLKFLLAGAVALLAGFGPASAEEPIVINAKKNLTTDFGAADKIFKENDPKVVYKLTPLTQAQFDRAGLLPDANRKAIGRRAAAVEEYHYTLDSASKQAEIEVEKALQDSLSGNKKTEEAETAKLGSCEFYVTANANGGITIMFRNSTTHFGRYEVMLEPLDSALNGTEGVHVWLDQNQWNCYYVTADQAVITRLNISWGSLAAVMGEYPVKGGVPRQWKLSVFRWSPEGASSLRGIPYENEDIYLNTPSFLQKDELNVKSGMVHGAVTSFYNVDPKKGNPTENYIGYIKGQRGSLVWYCNIFGLKVRHVYPKTFSEYYLADMVRRIPKEFPGEPQKTLDANYRLYEWQEEMVELGGFIKGQSSNGAMIDMIMRYEQPKFASPGREYQRLRIEAMRDRVFGPKFMTESEPGFPNHPPVKKADDDRK